MKRQLILILAVITVMLVLLIPVAGGSQTSLGLYVTTTMPMTTTTTGWDCISTPAPPTTTTTGWDCISTPPPTTTTTIILTGPDGTAPTTIPTTTEAVSTPCGNVFDLLSTARIVVSDTMSVLGYPSGGNWLCVDCYSYDGNTASIIPDGFRTPNSTYRYLHLTMIANVPLSMHITSEQGTVNAASLFPAEAINSDGTIQAGAYVLSGDTASLLGGFYPISEIAMTLNKPGSLTVGHIALSDDATCAESAPRIQTTTRPSFPWDDTTAPPVTTTTTVTTPTTNPTVGDALVPGDVDEDGLVSTADARLILNYCLGSTPLKGDGDFNGDGQITTHDVRLMLSVLTA